MARCRFYAEAFPSSPDVALLDLCSSWISHYPADLRAARVAGALLPALPPLPLLRCPLAAGAASPSQIAPQPCNLAQQHCAVRAPPSPPSVMQAWA